MKKAFTYTEVIIVLSIFIILISLTFSFVQTYRLNNDLKTNLDKFLSHARAQQSKSISGKGDQSYGIRLESKSYILFTGSSYNSEDSNNVKIDLPGKIEIKNILFSDSGADIIFSPPEGKADKTGNFQIYYSDTQYTTITINQLGGIEI